MSHTKAKGILFVTLGATCWGLSATCIQLLIQGWALSSEWVIAIRLAISGPTFLLIALVLHGKELTEAFRNGPLLVRIVAFGMVGILASQITYFHATALTNAGTAATLERLALLFILGWVCIQARRAPRLAEIAGIVLALAGVVLIATQGNVDTIVLPLDGLAWGVGSALCMAGYMILPEKPLQHYHPFVVTGIGTMAAALVANLFIQPWNIAVDINHEIVWVMFLLVAIGTIGAYVFYLHGIKECGSLLSGMLSCLVPVTAIIFSAIWLGTTVSMWDILGCALIIAMVFIVTKSTSTE